MDQLGSLCGGLEEAMAINLLITIIVTADREPIAKALKAFLRAESVGSIFEPTAYRDAMESGRLDQSVAVFGALLRAVDSVQAACKSPKAAIRAQETP